MARSFFDHLECGYCGERMDKEQLVGLCPCGRPLLARYRLEEAAAGWSREDLRGREPNLWRYQEMLPDAGEHRVSLGEGMTPLLEAPRLGASLGMEHLLLKEESMNPTGSFKARGMAVAVSMAAARGATRLALPSAGNAGSAAAAYAARAGLEVDLFLPDSTPTPFRLEAEASGARVHLLAGSIADCGRMLASRTEQRQWFDLSTLKEPYRLEGKKTMGYELAEQLDWQLPDVVVYPTGGGTGLIGMWKAFAEMEALGWVRRPFPRMVVVQAEGCAPMVRAFEAGAEFAEPWENPQTEAAGLRVPGGVGDFLILRTLRESEGTALAVSDADMRRGIRTLARAEGMVTCPEGGATVAAVRRLLETGFLEPHQRVVLFLTGTGLKYLESLVV
ncbi:MAG: threonine synthase [Acidobacteria bacterium]|nr:MAG: threonine synthase [Acidobacteriota bacterium]